MIVTLTPNPSVDRTLHIAELRRGAFIRATRATAEAGGKGINVARCLATQGHAATAVVPASTASAALLRELLGGIPPVEAVPIMGEMRTNVSIVEPDGTVTKVNEPGPSVLVADEAALLARVASLASPGGWVAAAGSLPPGLDTGLYARLRAALPGSVRLAVDADGPPLAACLGAGVDLVKPNHEELERLVGRVLRTLGDVVDAAAALVAGGIGQALVSLGADGAVLVSATGACHAEARSVAVVNNVGAGDALLAGFLAGLLSGRSGPDAVAEAVAWSVAACASPGTRMRPVTDADRAAVLVHDGVERLRRLGA
jgi:1-phosphofructokinase family hexose kinase